MQVDGSEGGLPWVGTGEAFMSSRMPVLGGNNERVVSHAGVYRDDDGITVGDGKCPAGHEVVLQVNKEESSHFSLQLWWGGIQVYVQMILILFSQDPLGTFMSLCGRFLKPFQHFVCVPLYAPAVSIVNAKIVGCFGFTLCSRFFPHSCALT